MKRRPLLAAATLALVSAGTLAAVQSATASSSERLADRACQWSVTQSGSGDGIELRLRGEKVSLKRVDNNPAKRVFVGDDDVSVEVLYGMPREEIGRILAEQAQQQDALAAASLADAVESGSDVEVNETYRGKGTPRDLVPVAYRVADDEVEEAGALFDGAHAQGADAKCVKKAAGADSELVVW